jgi:hypothetical protein
MMHRAGDFFSFSFSSASTCTHLGEGGMGHAHGREEMLVQDDQLRQQGFQTLDLSQVAMLLGAVLVARADGDVSRRRNETSRCPSMVGRVPLMPFYAVLTSWL